MRGKDKIKKRKGGGKGWSEWLLCDWISASDSLKLPQICITMYSSTTPPLTTATTNHHHYSHIDNSFVSGKTLPVANLKARTTPSKVRRQWLISFEGVFKLSNVKEERRSDVFMAAKLGQLERFMWQRLSGAPGLGRNKGGNNWVLAALFRRWSELLALFSCQGFPKTRQGLAEGKPNKTQQAGRLNLKQVRFLEAHFISWHHTQRSSDKQQHVSLAEI